MLPFTGVADVRFPTDLPTHQAVVSYEQLLMEAQPHLHEREGSVWETVDQLALAQAVMEGQRVLVLDEPFNALDTDAVDLVRGLLDRHRAGGGTVVFTSHNSEDVDALADHRHRIRAHRLEQLT